MTISDKIKEDAIILRTVYLLSFHRVSNILLWLSTEWSNSMLPSTKAFDTTVFVTNSNLMEFQVAWEVFARVSS